MRTPFALALGCTILLVGCGGSKAPSEPSPNPGFTGNTVTIRGAGYDGGGTAAFTPPTLTVDRGATVDWENADSITHSVVSETSVFKGDIGPSGSFEFKFNSAGSFPYRCTIHGMTGTIIVR